VSDRIRSTASLGMKEIATNTKTTTSRSTTTP
jgi:hypothetical protein